LAHALDPHQIVETTERLQQRVYERFPTANLCRFAGELVAVARKAELRTAWIGRPFLPLRVAVAGLLAVAAVVLGFAIHEVPVSLQGTQVSEMLQSFDAAISSIAFMGAAVFFLVTMESRVKRLRAVRAIRELRGMAHLVDMHQLVKDPKDPRLTGVDTASSPKQMSPYEMYRYLDYCSEMLALLSKIAQLYVNDLDDRVALDYVDGLERLVQGLSDKIWRKMAMVDRMLSNASNEELPALLTRGSKSAKSSDDDGAPPVAVDPAT
jgi:hypothetical protein